MSISAEEFSKGLTYEAYMAQITRNRERFLANEQRFEPDPADLAVFQSLPAPLHVLVIAEDWCGDVVDNLPVLGRLAAKSGKLDLRVFPRDQNLDLMDRYLNQGKFRSIPVFVLLDDRFQELGRFVERPVSVTERRARFKQEYFGRHPELGSPDTPVDQLPEEPRVRYMQELAKQREEWKPLDERDVVLALRYIVERAVA